MRIGFFASRGRQECCGTWGRGLPMGGGENPYAGVGKVPCAVAGGLATTERGSRTAITRNGRIAPDINRRHYCRDCVSRGERGGHGALLSASDYGHQRTVPLHPQPQEMLMVRRRDRRAEAVLRALRASARNPKCRSSDSLG